MAHCHKVSNAQCMLVTREQPRFQAPFEGYIVLLCTKVIGQRVPDCRTLHSECSVVNSGEPVSWHHHQLMCGWPETLPACNIGDQCATVDEVLQNLAMLTSVHDVNFCHPASSAMINRCSQF